MDDGVGLFILLGGRAVIGSQAALRRQWPYGRGGSSPLARTIRLVYWFINKLIKRALSSVG